jgi:uncharacterized membrane protein YjfL (UPF0719 family)
LTPEQINLWVLDFGHLAIYLILIFIAKMINDICTPYNLQEQLVEKDNPAIAISLASYLAAVTVIFVGTMQGPIKALKDDLLETALYGLMGIILLNISRLINDKVLFRRFSNIAELVEDQNIGIAAVQAGSYLASGFLVAGAIHGEGGGIGTVLAFYLLGQFSLLLLVIIYNLITPYDVHDELAKDNFAAGISLSGAMIALGLIVMKAIDGDFVSWSDHMGTYAWTISGALFLFPILRLGFDKIIIPGVSLNREISEDRNAGLAFLEGGLYISVAAVITSIMA